MRKWGIKGIIIVRLIITNEGFSFRCLTTDYRWWVVTGNSYLYLYYDFLFIIMEIAFVLFKCNALKKNHTIRTCKTFKRISKIEKLVHKVYDKSIPFEDSKDSEQLQTLLCELIYSMNLISFQTNNSLFAHNNNVRLWPVYRK